MHIIIWQFTVREEHIPEFVSAYGANGDWATLFRRSDGFLGTELLRSAQHSNVFVTIDRWQSVACFEGFQERFGAEYTRLDAQLAGYTLAEEKIGAFSEA